MAASRTLTPQPGDGAPCAREKRLRSRARVAAWLACASLAVAAGGAQAESFCPVEQDPGRLKVSADRIDALPPGRARLRGHAQIEYDRKRVRADSIHYSDNRIHAKGNVLYTACPTENPIWFLSAEEFVGDLDQRKASAKNLKLYVGGKQVASLPRYLIPFGKNQRKTGFLTPGARYESNSGYRLRLPFYLNLAPNYDAEIAPSYLSKRGLMLDGEFRSLGAHSKNLIRAEGIDDTQYNEHRYLLNAEHTTRFGDFFRIGGVFRRTSDKDYLDDISPHYEPDVLGSYLHSNLNLDYAVDGWRLQFITESFQLSDRSIPEERPFARKPQVMVAKDGRLPGVGLNYRLETHYSDFHRTKDEDLRRGTRMGGGLSLERPFETPGYYITPGVELDYVHYDLPSRENETRTAPTYRLRGGLRRSRLTPGRRFIHTFEPEIAYVYRPERSQEDIPLFDTKISDLDLAQVLNGDYFNGIDRVHDANQIGVVVNTRLLDAKTGDQIARLGMGQIRHLSRPETCLYYRPDGSCLFGRDDYPASDYVSEFDLNMSERAYFKSSLLWDGENNGVARSLVKLHVNDGRGSVANFIYRKRRRATRDQVPNPLYNDSTEQFNMNFGVNLPNGWAAAAHWGYDLRRKKYLEYLVGAQYKSCCWGMRLAFRRHLADIDPAYAGGDVSIEEGEFDYDTFVGLEFFIGEFDSGDRSRRLIQRRIENFFMP